MFSHLNVLSLNIRGIEGGKGVGVGGEGGGGEGGRRRNRRLTSSSLKIASSIRSRIFIAFAATASVDREMDSACDLDPANNSE